MMGSVMADVKPRKRTKVTRREQARATRLRITQAAYRLFCERGYAGTTMADVAVAAGVAVQTVYFTFHTKSELLSGAYELAVLGELDPLPPERQPWYVAASEERDVRRALSVLVRGVGEIVRRAAPLDAVVRATGSHDPEAAAIRAYHERLRVEGYRGLVEMLEAKMPLRPGLTPEGATELIVFYLGPHAFTGLVTDGGWAYDDWLDWTVGTIYEQFFGIGAQGG